MNFFENEYAVPVILGSGKSAISVATLLHRDTDLKVHIFASKLSLIDRMLFRFHRILSESEDILLLSLNDFADTLQDYHTPMLIYCDDTGMAFVERNFDKLEQRYVIISAQAVQNSFLKDGDSKNDHK